MALYTRPEDPDEIDENKNEIVVPQVTGKPKKEGTPAHENEDLSWKDRYSNLRSYSQKQINALEKKVNELARQLNASQNTINLPKTKEEVEAWAKKYPEPYAFVKSIIGMDLTSVTEDVSSRLNEINAREAKAAKREAELELAKLHPDFFGQISEDENFVNWLSTKSKRMQDALYEDDDPVAAAEVITLFKVETGYGKKTRKNTSQNAAEDIPTRYIPKPNNGTGEYDFTESQIDAMSPREYDEREEEIEKARRSGRILYDMTGAAM